MRTIVTFQSDRFNNTESHEYFMNAHCFGDDVCKWMIEQLEKNGIKCDAEPGQEDFGWYFNFSVDDKKHCFVCSFRWPDDDHHGIWIGWIERSVSLISSLFGGRERGIDPMALRKIHELLARTPGISDVRWHHKSEFDRGNEVAGKSDPD